MKMFVALLVAALLIATAAGAQTPAFEVASVKPNPSVTENSGENTVAGRFTATNDTLKDLLQLAFDVKSFQIVGGPGWLDAARFDIVATTGKPGDISDAELRPMLQALLADRLQAEAREQFNLPIYFADTTRRRWPGCLARKAAGPHDPRSYRPDA